MAEARGPRLTRAEQSSRAQSSPPKGSKRLRRGWPRSLAQTGSLGLSACSCRRIAPLRVASGSCKEKGLWRVIEAFPLQQLRLRLGLDDDSGPPRVAYDTKKLPPRHATPRHATPRHATPRHATHYARTTHARTTHALRTHAQPHLSTLHPPIRHVPKRRYRSQAANRTSAAVKSVAFWRR